MQHYPADARFYLKQEFETRLLRRPHYSLRAYARDLDLSPSSLSEFLNGHLGLSRARVVDLAKKLRLQDDQPEHFRDLVESKFARSLKARRLAEIRVKSRIHGQQNRLSLDIFKIVSDWRHLAILETLPLDSKYQSVAYLARSLGTKSKVVRECIERLINTGLLVNDGEKLVPGSDETFVGQDISSDAIRRFHHQMLEQAGRALEEQSVDKREFSSSVFSLAREDLPAVKEDLKKFRLELMSRYTANLKKNAVYGLNIQLFDLLKDLTGQDAK